ncbi:hypothetical protein [Peribacillus deserti]|uniref:Uncharacterized protein n=1 Tax=Peribacillus deserti TaxID=673318 RepID=A0A2N5M4H1_9BACI|nr:hypothetical protein [Peribacillus deserti]PLT29260.1 hypothetical protein CUU66_13905 [Peribacillus deserti]
MEYIVFNGRIYRVEVKQEKIYLIDTSNAGDIKINFSFSKDPKDHETAAEGLKMFWTELYN